MPADDSPFFFDVNYSFGVDSVFTDVTNEFSNVNPAPPISGFFLLLQGDPLLLLNGTEFDLL